MNEKAYGAGDGVTMFEIAREIFWPRSFSGKMGRLIGALSILSLIRYAFHVGLSEAFKAVLTYYNELLRVALGWLDPYVWALVHNFLVSLRIEIHFSELWHHIFVVLSVLFFRDAGVAFSDGRPVTGLFRLLVGACIAVITSILASSNYGQMSEHLQNIVIASLPILGIYAYDIVLYLYSAAFQITYLNEVNQTPERTRITFLKGALGRATHRFVLGLVAIALSFLVPGVWDLPAPAGGLVALAFATVVNVSYWLWRGTTYAQGATSKGRRWFDAFKESEAGRFGLAVTSVFAWIAIFTFINAGMKQLGM